MMCNMLFCIMYIDHEFAIYKMCTQLDNYFNVIIITCTNLSVIIISFMFTRESVYTIIHLIRPMQVRMYMYTVKTGLALIFVAPCHLHGWCFNFAYIALTLFARTWVHA